MSLPIEENPSMCENLQQYLQYFYGVEYIVMGRTIHDSINTECDDRLIRTDVALSRAFGGTLKSKRDTYQVLEIIQESGKSPIINIISN